MRPYFVMPLLPGSTLDRMIKGSGQLTIQRSVDVLTQVCRGLGAAHERGLVHRDLKPGNIFVMPDDSVEIIDFGVAHMTSAGAHRRAKRDAAVHGAGAAGNEASFAAFRHLRAGRDGLSDVHATPSF